jgi:hypothetical protein
MAEIIFLEDMVNLMKLNRLPYLPILFFLINCNPNRFLEYSSQLKDTKINYDEIIARYVGYLKEDFKVQTPYGSMTASACGRSSGYDYDFAYYQNGNLSVIFLKERKDIIYNNMRITLPSIDDMDNVFSARIEFFQNYKIRFCVTLNDVVFKDTVLPKMTRLHFDKDGELKSFTIYNDWNYKGILYNDGQQFHIINGSIIPI